MSRSCIHLVPRSRAWPAKLDQIEAPPSELWCVGSLALLEREPKVALIGTRAPTPYGQAQARAFATRLASAGVVIVSGLARGIDSEAHEAALDCQGATIAVLGSGVDRPWPAGPLAERMTVAGLLVSEYAPGTPPRRHHFPERNRLISGLCEAVIVIEAAYASGSLITARWAADQGRTVFALPGRVDHPMARGCHRLLREGASLVEDPEEVLVELGLAPSVPLEEAGAERAAGDRANSDRRAESRERVEGVPRSVAHRPVAHRGGESRGRVDRRDVCLGGLKGQVYEALRGETLTPDDLAERTAQPLTEVLTALVELELEGLVVRGAGALYRR